MSFSERNPNVYGLIDIFVVSEQERELSFDLKENIWQKGGGSVLLLILYI